MDDQSHFEMPRDFGIEDVQAEDQKDPEGSNEYTIDGGSLDDGVIQEVDATERTDIVNGGETRIGDIEDAKFNGQEDRDVLHGGSIFWDSLETYHKVKWRGYITGTTLLLWSILTIAGLVVYANTGNLSLLIFAPGAATGIALYRVLFKLLHYYFSS